MRVEVIPSLLTEKQAARVLGVSIACLRDGRARIARGRIRVPVLKIGRLIRYDPADLREFLRGCKRFPAGSDSTVHSGENSVA